MFSDTEEYFLHRHELIVRLSNRQALFIIVDMLNDESFLASNTCRAGLHSFVISFAHKLSLVHIDTMPDRLIASFIDALTNLSQRTGHLSEKGNQLLESLKREEKRRQCD